MNPELIWAFIFFSIMGVFGDIALKMAGAKADTNWTWLVVGVLSHMTTGLGWFYLMRRERITIIGPMLTITNTVLIIFFGLLLFQEKINAREALAIVFAVASLALLIKW
jgi:drug/metabolite transporter (DMT)-like permease